MSVPALDLPALHFTRQLPHVLAEAAAEEEARYDRYMDMGQAPPTPEAVEGLMGLGAARMALQVELLVRRYLERSGQTP